MADLIQDIYGDVDLNGSLSDALTQLQQALKDSTWQNLHLQVEGGSGSDFVKLHIVGQRLPNEDEIAQQAAEDEKVKARDVAELVRLKEAYQDVPEVWDVIVLEKAVEVRLQAEPVDTVK